MREHWQPDIFSSLEQGSKARALMVERARAASLTPESSLLFLPPSRRGLLTQLPRPLRVVSATLSAVIGLASAACGPTPAPTPINPERTKIPSTQTIQKTSLENFLPFKGLSRLTGGPHDSFRKGGIRDGFDVAPDVSVACSPGVRKVLDEPLVVASASGVVKKVGNEKDRNDPDHSIVEIKKADGSIVGAMHLDQIQVSVGDKVIGGETVVGKVSCEVPLEGYTEAMHVHVSFGNQQGKQIPIEGHVFSGYTVHAADKESDGTMTKDGQIITAINGKRCGPDENSIKACGGKRNDLNTGAVLGESVKAAPLPTVAAAKPAPTEVKPAPGFHTHRSIVAPYQIDYLRGWRVSAFSDPKDNSTLEQFFDGVSNNNMRVRSEKINSWVTAEDYRDDLINQLKAFTTQGIVSNITPKSVDGRDGWMFEYRSKYGSSMIVVFKDKSLGWQISLTGRSNLTDQEISIFNQMVDSMKLR